MAGQNGTDLGLQEQQRVAIASYLRFAKFQRAQRLRSVEACFQDVADTRLVEDTYTVDEVKEVMEELRGVVRAEVEGELIHAAHTNSLLLAGLLKQAQKWHLHLDVDTSDMENQDLLDEVKRFEEQEEAAARAMDITSPKKVTLAPLTEAEGPVGLLQAEIQRLGRENSELETKLQSTLEKLNDVTKSKLEATLNLQSTKEQLERLQREVVQRPTSTDIAEMCEEVEGMRLRLTSETQTREATQEQLTRELTSSKSSLLQVQAQLQLAEKELEKKFSQTGAYKNMKKLMNKKNEQLKKMRKRLEIYEPNSEDVTED